MAADAPIFTRKQVAEFNTSQDTLRQIATMEWNIDEQFRLIYGYGLSNNDIPAIKSLYYYLVKVYADRIHAIMWTRLQIEADEREKMLNDMYEDWSRNNPNKLPTRLLEELRLYKRWLYEIKQKVLRLGVPTKVEYSSQEALQKAIEQ